MDGWMGGVEGIHGVTTSSCSQNKNPKHSNKLAEASPCSPLVTQQGIRTSLEGMVASPSIHFPPF